MTVSTPPDEEASRPVVEIEFSINDSKYPFVAATENGSCIIELAEMIPRQEKLYSEFFNITGSDTDRVLDLAESYETLDVFLLRENEDGGLFEFTASGKCPAYSLAELGALPREAIAADGQARITAEVPPQYDAVEVIEAFLAENPDATLKSKRNRDSFSPFFTHSVLDELIQHHLTERQREVLEFAFDAGYYDWPREYTGQEIAEDLGITSATFSEHIQAAERKLLSALFDQSKGA